jgi:hypothetical protein
MSKVDRYFDEEIKAIAVDSKVIAIDAAEELRDDVLRQIRRNFSKGGARTALTAAWARGVKIYELDDGAKVFLSSLLSYHGIPPGKTEGNPRLWILLPDGKKLGFKRIGKGFNWDTLKRRYGTKLSFVSVNDGTVVLYRSEQGVKPIYKIQSEVRRKQRIEFYESAARIGTERGFSEKRNPGFS